MAAMHPRLARVTRWSQPALRALALSLVLVGCGGGSSPTAPLPPPIADPSLPSLVVTSSQPAVGATLRAGSTQRFVVSLHFSAGQSTSQPEFLVGHLKQLRRGVVIDDPGDFHFFVSGREGDTEATIERDLLANADTCRIAWVMAVRDANGLVAVNGPLLVYSVAP
ncbi:MAG: hypothetical protein ABI609_11825 [Acidobacteriota bacterium]